MRKLLSSIPLRTLLVVAIVAAVCLLGFGIAYHASAQPQPTPDSTQGTTTTQGTATSQSALAILSQAVAATGGMSSGTGDVNINVNVTTDPAAASSGLQAILGQPITLTGTYSFTSDPTAFDSSMTLGIAGQSVPVGVREIGGQAWVQALGQWYETSSAMMGGTTGASLSQADITGIVQALTSSGIDPSTWLAGLTVVGQENVGGSTAYHLNATVDVNKALSDVLGAMQQNGAAMMGSSGITSSDLSSVQATVSAWLQSLTVDVWVATDTYQFRQFQVSANIMPPAGQGQGIQSIVAQATVILSPATTPVSITAPTNVRPFSDLQQSLSILMGLFNGGNTGSSGTTAPSPQGTTTSTTATGMPGTTSSTDMTGTTGYSPSTNTTWGR